MSGVSALLDKRVLIVGSVLLCVVMVGLYNQGSFPTYSAGLGVSAYTTVAEGSKDSLDFKRYFFDHSGNRISPWHDIPLQPDNSPSNVFNFICEIPKGSRAKFETNKETEFNPIIQDTKKGKLRFYHSDSLVNYGAIPQTWEDPEHEDPDTKATGDNDPLDVIEIGSTACNSGDIYPVKVVGALAMLDDGEMDWKIVVIALSDPLAQHVANIGDDNKDANPGVQEFLTQVRIWFRDYKLPDGKPENTFAFDDKYVSDSKAVSVITEQNGFWKALVEKNQATAKSFTEKPWAKFWWH